MYSKEIFLILDFGKMYSEFHAGDNVNLTNDLTLRSG